MYKLLSILIILLLSATASATNTSIGDNITVVNNITAQNGLFNNIYINNTPTSLIYEPILTQSTNEAFLNGLKQWIILTISNITGLQSTLDNINSTKWNKTDDINTSIQININQVNNLRTEQDAQNTSITNHIVNISNPHIVTLEQARVADNTISGDINANGNSIINPHIKKGVSGVDDNYGGVDVTDSGFIRLYKGKTSTGTLIEYYIYNNYFDMYSYSPTFEGIMSMTDDSMSVQFNPSTPGNTGLHTWSNRSYSLNTPIISTLATGTSPIQVTSTTNNTNLNADMIDGLHSSDILTDNLKNDLISLIFLNATADNKYTVTYPANATIIGAQLLSTESQTLNVTVWKDTYANYPPTAADTISSGFVLSNATNMYDTTLTGWNTDISLNDIFIFNIISSDTVNDDVTVTLFVRRD